MFYDMQCPETRIGDETIIDEIDYKLILELQKNARQKYVAIARELGMSEAGVRKRMARLLDQGIIQLTAVPAPGKVGYHSAALVGIHVKMGQIEKVAKQLTDHPNIQFVGIMAGQYDMFITVLCHSPTHLAKFLTEDLSQVEGITSLESFVILKTNKRAYWCLPELPMSHSIEETDDSSRIDEYQL